VSPRLRSAACSESPAAAAACKSLRSRHRPAQATDSIPSRPRPRRSPRRASPPLCRPSASKAKSNPLRLPGSITCWGFAESRPGRSGWPGGDSAAAWGGWPAKLVGGAPNVSRPRPWRHRGRDSPAPDWPGAEGAGARRTVKLFGMGAYLGRVPGLSALAAEVQPSHLPAR